MIDLLLWAQRIAEATFISLVTELVFVAATAGPSGGQTSERQIVMPDGGPPDTAPPGTVLPAREAVGQAQAQLAASRAPETLQLAQLQYLLACQRSALDAEQAMIETRSRALTAGLILGGVGFGVGLWMGRRERRRMSGLRKTKADASEDEV